VKDMKCTLHLNKAAICDKQGRLEDSIEQCTKALELRPHSVKALFRRGVWNSVLQCVAVCCNVLLCSGALSVL